MALEANVKVFCRGRSGSLVHICVNPKKRFFFCVCEGGGGSAR